MNKSMYQQAKKLLHKLMVNFGSKDDRKKLSLGNNVGYFILQKAPKILLTTLPSHLN